MIPSYDSILCHDQNRGLHSHSHSVENEIATVLPYPRWGPEMISVMTMVHFDSALVRPQERCFTLWEPSISRSKEILGSLYTCNKSRYSTISTVCTVISKRQWQLEFHPYGWAVITLWFEVGWAVSGPEEHALWLMIQHLTALIIDTERLETDNAVLQNYSANCCREELETFNGFCLMGFRVTQ